MVDNNYYMIRGTELGEIKATLQTLIEGEVPSEEEALTDLSYVEQAFQQPVTPPTASPKTKAAPMMKTLRRLLFGSSGGRALARRARRPGLVGVPHSGQNSASVGTRAPHCAQVTFAVSLRRER